MNIFIPATVGVAAISFLANFLGPPLLVAVAPPTPPTSAFHCEGYFPDTDICLPLGSSRPSWFRRNRSNAACPQWRIDPGWAGRNAFTSKLTEIESLAKEWESILIEMTPVVIVKCGGEEGVKPPVWIRSERGVAWSRMQDGIIAGNSEYHTDRPEVQGGHVCWTDAVLPMYVEKYGVKPSDEFILFVSTFDLSAFKGELNNLKQKL